MFKHSKRCPTLLANEMRKSYFLKSKERNGKLRQLQLSIIEYMGIHSG